MPTIRSLEELQALYGSVREAATVKEVSRLTLEYRALLQASPFAILATSGPEGLDCSPRGDHPGFVRIVDDATLLLPDRRGNNRIDSLSNIVQDPRVALLFMIPGVGNTLRINGRAEIRADADLLESFAIDGKAPRTVITVNIETVFFQCARAIVRSELWNPDKYVDPKGLPTAGQILDTLSSGQIDGDAYDEEWPERAKNSLW